MQPKPLQVRLPEVRDLRPEHALARLRIAVSIAHDRVGYMNELHGKGSRQYREAVELERKAVRRFECFNRVHHA